MNGNLLKVLSGVPTSILIGFLAYPYGWLIQMTILSCVLFAQYEFIDWLKRGARKMKVKVLVCLGIIYLSGAIYLAYLSLLIIEWLLSIPVELVEYAGAALFTAGLVLPTSLGGSLLYLYLFFNILSWLQREKEKSDFVAFWEEVVV